MFLDELFPTSIEHMQLLRNITVSLLHTCGLAWCLCIPVGGSGQFVQVEAEVVGGPANGSEGVDALESMSVLVPLPLSSFTEFCTI